MIGHNEVLVRYDKRFSHRPLDLPGISWSVPRSQVEVTPLSSVCRQMRTECLGLQYSLSTFTGYADRLSWFLSHSTSNDNIKYVKAIKIRILDRNHRYDSKATTCIFDSKTYELIRRLLVLTTIERLVLDWCSWDTLPLSREALLVHLERQFGDNKKSQLTAESEMEFEYRRR